MNIFYLDHDPVVAAQMSCDKHVVKMIVESAQMLSTAHRMIDGNEYSDKTKSGRKIKRWKHPNPNLENTLYKACHTGHPSTLWVMESAYNYHWLYRHMMALNTEFKMRYGHILDHKTVQLLEGPLMYPPRKISLNKIATEPPPAMPDYCKIPGDVIESYRKYYCLEKTSFATWKSPASTPLWYTEGVKYYNNTAEI